MLKSICTRHAVESLFQDSKEANRPRIRGCGMSRGVLETGCLLCSVSIHQLCVYRRKHSSRKSLAAGAFQRFFRSALALLRTFVLFLCFCLETAEQTSATFNSFQVIAAGTRELGCPEMQLEMKEIRHRGHCKFDAPFRKRTGLDFQLTKLDDVH